MKKMLNTLLCTCLFVLAGCSDDKGTDKPDTGDRRPATSQELAHRNLERSIALIDTAVDNYFTGETMSMSRYYNPYTGSKSGELGSIWMYTSAIEAVNAAMHGMSASRARATRSSTMPTSHVMPRCSGVSTTMRPTIAAASR